MSEIIMNKRIKAKRTKILEDKIIKIANKIPHETLHINKHGVVTNLNQLSKDTKDWILHG